MPELANAKRERFCQEFLIDLNATRAAIRAGYAESGAHTEGYRLLRNAEVDARIHELKVERGKRLHADQDFVIGKLVEMLGVKLEDLYDESGRLKLPSEMPDAAQLAVIGIDVTEEWGPREDGPGKEVVGYTKKVKRVDPVRVLAELRAHLVGDTVNVRGGTVLKLVRDYSQGTRSEG